MKKIFIVIPAYNEGRRIRQLLWKLRKQKYYSIVVDDGSYDNTYNVSASTANVTVRHDVNLGKGAAMKTGADYAFLNGADAVIFMDSDGQHKVEDLAQFIKVFNNTNSDIIFGVRNLNERKMPIIRLLGNKIASGLIYILFGIYATDLISGYRGITRHGYEKIKWESQGYAVETEMVIRTAKEKLNYCEVPIATIYYDKFKGVSILDALNILISVLWWRIKI